MRTKFLSRFLTFSLICITAVIVISCEENRSNDASETFTSEQMVTINQLVSYYDSIVQAAHPEITDIDTAYKVYLDSVCPLILETGNMGLSGINISARNKLFDRLDRKTLDEIFIIGDTLKYFSLSKKKKIKKYYPYYVKINNKGAYMVLLNELSKKNDFIRRYYNQIREFGDLTPACYGMILRDYNQLDFSDPMQRLIFIVNVLDTNEEIKDRFRH